MNDEELKQMNLYEEFKGEEKSTEDIINDKIKLKIDRESLLKYTIPDYLNTLY